MTDEERKTIMCALKLQGDMKMKFMQMKMPEIMADEAACEAMHLMMVSEAVKPEIKEVYESIASA